MSKHQRVVDRIRIHESDLAAAQKEYGELLNRLELDPQKADLLAQRDALEREIADHELNIRREQLKLEYAKSADTAETRAGELAQSERDVEHVDKNLERISELDFEVIEHLHSIAPLLAERERLAVDNVAVTWAALKRCYGRDGAEKRHDVIVSLARGAASRGMLVDALFASGIGRVGLDLGDFVSVAPVRSQRTLGEANGLARGKVAETLNAAIEHRKAEFAGKNPSKDVPTQRDRFIQGGRQLEKKDDFVTLRDSGQLS